MIFGDEILKDLFNSIKGACFEPLMKIRLYILYNIKVVLYKQHKGILSDL